jgi:hypothetical protein
MSDILSFIMCLIVTTAHDSTIIAILHKYCISYFLENFALLAVMQHSVHQRYDLQKVKKESPSTPVTPLLTNI